ncbi:hypothetical protein [uncultured Chryseobacterium sp.]
MRYTAGFSPHPKCCFRKPETLPAGY